MDQVETKKAGAQTSAQLLGELLEELLALVELFMQSLATLPNVLRESSQTKEASRITK